jgi:amidase
MTISEAYDNHDAVGLAALVRAGELTPDELLDEALRRVDERNPAINAVWSTFEARARQQIAAGLGRGDLAGVPFLIKDLEVDIAGEVTTNGSRFFADAVATTTSTVVERYLAAGLVVFGKTATPEFGLNASTEPRAFGPTRNPWALDRSAGGSSGGAGAATAAGIVPAAHATDGGGSIRIPASCNGLFGLKPTRGLVPSGPRHGEKWNGLSTSHVVARTVRDSAAFLDAVAGASTGAPYSAPPMPKGGYVAAMHDDPGRLRVGLVTTARPGIAVDPECVLAAENAAVLLGSLGHEIEVMELPIDWPALLGAFGVITGTHVAVSVATRAAALGRDPGPEDLEPMTHLQVATARSRSAPDYVQAVQAMHLVGRTLGEFFSAVDVVLTPTLGAVPLPIGTLVADPADLPTFAALAGQVAQFLGFVNGTGQPAMSLPLHWSPEGLPVGVQVIGRFGADALLLALARQIEAAQPWRDRRPPRA